MCHLSSPGIHCKRQFTKQAQIKVLNYTNKTSLPITLMSIQVAKYFSFTAFPFSTFTFFIYLWHIQFLPNLTLQSVLCLFQTSITISFMFLFSILNSFILCLGLLHFIALFMAHLPFFRCRWFISQPCFSWTCAQKLCVCGWAWYCSLISRFKAKGWVIT